ncbi:hypothetical protein GCM10010404_93770 [Nonomuraea africana]|nr:DUF6461 domain-containing protein [Nonomuraea africana]
MRESERLYHLLRSYDDSDQSLSEFNAVWCEGLSTTEVARRLHADVATARPAMFRNWGPGSDGSGEWDSGILVGSSGTWIVVFGDHRCVSDTALTALSRGGGRAVAIRWNGAELLKYAVDGEMKVTINIVATQYRTGSDPTLLDRHMGGLRFDIGGPDNADPVDPRESFTSALVVIGRITGQEINKEWLDEPHVGYIVPADPR